MYKYKTRKLNYKIIIINLYSKSFVKLLMFIVFTKKKKTYIKNLMCHCFFHYKKEIDTVYCKMYEFIKFNS